MLSILPSGAYTPIDLLLLMKDDCSAHFIRTVVLEEIVLSELRKMTTFVRENEADFLQSAYECSQI